MLQRNQALVDAMETHGYDVKDLANKMGVTLPAVYNWIRGGRPRAAQRAKLEELLGIEIKKTTKNEVETTTPKAVPVKANGEPKTNGTHPAPARLVTVRVSGDGLLLEMQVKHETAAKVIEVLGFTPAAS